MSFEQQEMGHGASPEPQDIRDQLRQDHESVLAGLEALRDERDERHAQARLGELRRVWMIHALAEETVVYRALEGAQAAAPGARAEERFVEHELVGGLFDKLVQSRAGTLEWGARINVVRELISRHIDSEHGELFLRLASTFTPNELREMAQRFRLARDKLLMLERAKAA